MRSALPRRKPINAGPRRKYDNVKVTFMLMAPWLWREELRAAASERGLRVSHENHLALLRDAVEEEQEKRA